MTIYKKIFGLVLFGGMSLLTACGGGGSGGGGGDGGTIPTPPATDLVGLFASSEDKTFTANSGVLTLNGVATDNSSSTSQQVIYDGGDKSLRVNITGQGGGFNVTFTQSEIVAAISLNSVVTLPPPDAKFAVTSTLPVIKKLVVLTNNVPSAYPR